jgi:hypothetical protein
VSAPGPGGGLLGGRYRLGGELGSGGMGTVWRARDEELGRDVAVKELTLPREVSGARREQAVQRVLREARAAARLRHPGIVTVHTVVHADGRPWIVMELLSGRSLDEVLRDDGPLEPQRAAALAAEVLDALSAAHERGVLHRDVKPANVFLRDDGRAVLTDFGIATLAGDASLTRPGALIGSPAYMAPERIRGEPGGPPSDLWSLAATLYALVEGHPPFDRSTRLGVLGAVLTEEPARPRRAGPLAPLLLGLLDKDPDRRPGADTVRRELKAIAGTGVEPGAGRASPRRPRRAGRAGRRLPGRGAIAAAAALIIAAFAGLAMTRGGAEDDRHPTARTPPPTFAAVPPVCGLLRADQIGRYIPSPAAAPLAADPANDYFSQGSAPGDERSCEWDDPGTPGGREFRATVRIRLAQGTSPQDAIVLAVNAFSRLEDDARTGQYTDSKSPWPESIGRGVGDEAYKIGTTGEKGRLHRATVVSRTANLLMEVRYESLIPKALSNDGLYDGWERLYNAAEQISRWMIAALQTVRSRPPSRS